MATTPTQHQPAVLVRFTAALATLTVHIAVRSLRFDRVTAAVNLLVGQSRRAATTEEAVRVLQTIDSGADLLPVRVACLERSLTAVVLLALRRRRITWCLGVRRPPLTWHGWIADTDHTPIGEPPIHVTYHAVRTLPMINETATR
jgi:hypothetical protein